MARAGISRYSEWNASVRVPNNADHLCASSPVTLLSLTEWNLRILGSFIIATCILSQRIRLLSHTTRQMIVRGNQGYHRHQAKRHTSSANTRQVMRRECAFASQNHRTQRCRGKTFCTTDRRYRAPRSLPGYGNCSKNFYYCMKSKHCCLR